MVAVQLLGLCVGFLSWVYHAFLIVRASWLCGGSLIHSSIDPKLGKMWSRSEKGLQTLKNTVRFGRLLPESGTAAGGVGCAGWRDTSL